VPNFGQKSRPPKNVVNNIIGFLPVGVGGAEL